MQAGRVQPIAAAAMGCQSALPTRQQLVSLALIAVLGALWGSSYAAVAYALPTIPPITLTAARVCGAALILGAFALAQGHSFPRDAETWLRLLVLGAINPALAWSLMAWGQQYVGGGLAGVINTLSPLFAVVLIALWTHSERITVPRLAGIALGFVGVVVVLGPGVDAGSGDTLLAKCAILLATAGYALAALFGRHFRHLPPSVVATCAMTGACAFLVPASVLLEQPWTLTPAPVALGVTALLTVFCTAVAFLIYFRLLQTIGSAGTLTVGYIRVGVAVVMGSALHGEPITGTLLAGLACVLAGVVLATRDPG